LRSNGASTRHAPHVESRRGADAPATGPVQQPIPAPPPRWKQAVTIWLVPGFAEWPLVLRVLLATLLLTPVMTYLVLPWVTRMLRPWLQRQS
jgi:antibiotic biosynthesis monooxygenase (ABM) superfamily enzyme